MRITDLPAAAQVAEELLWSEVGKLIPPHRLRFELTTEPDQYRVSWLSPEDGFEYRSLVPRITLTAHQFEAWQTWLDSTPEGTS